MSLSQPHVRPIQRGKRPNPTEFGQKLHLSVVEGYLFEQMGGTYTQQGDYYLPDLKLPPEEGHPVGVWGQRRLRFLREHRPILYANLKTTGQLRSHLADVEEQANDFFRLVKDCAASEGVTEQLRAEEPMEWVRRMNEIRARAFAVIHSQMIDI